jgi:pimeloyl-ACP methyl ester carboxylesterase
MAAQPNTVEAPAAPIWGELRYSAELARLLADRDLWARRGEDPPPVMLIPGFMAGDASLLVMRRWLRQRGHRVSMSGIQANVDCAGRAVARLRRRLLALSLDSGRPVVLIGQSRGGVFARALAASDPEHVQSVAMLGSPVGELLAIAPSVRRTVRFLAQLGDLRVPGFFSTSCQEGDCCEAFRDSMQAPLSDEMQALSIYSRSDGIVDWRACIDGTAEAVEVESSHCGMSVNADVYRELERLLG